MEAVGQHSEPMVSILCVIIFEAAMKEMSTSKSSHHQGQVSM